MIRKTLRGTTTEKIQQWWCKTCRSSFTFRASDTRVHFTAIFIREAVRDFIQGRSPVAVIHERKGVSVGTLSSWVHQFGNACMNPMEMSGALRFRTTNRWSGTLLLDGKYLNKKQVLLLAIDYGTLDIVAWLVTEQESGESYSVLVDMVRACGYTIRAMVSDGEPGLLALTQPTKQYAYRKRYPVYHRAGHPVAEPHHPILEGIPHQWCVVHAQRELERRLRLTTNKENREILMPVIHDILFARTIHQAERAKNRLSDLTFSTPLVYQRITLWIVKRWPLLMTHFSVRVHKRKIPRSSNAVENIISYVNTRLKTMRRLRTTASAVPITNLIVVNYRSKCFTNPKNTYHRGKSPLALVTGTKQKFDWMQFIKKSCS